MKLPSECSLLMRALSRLRLKIAGKLERIDRLLAETGLSGKVRARLQALQAELEEAVRRSEELEERLHH